MSFKGKPYNEDNVFHMKRELGDICWYLAQAFMALDTNFDEILDMNIEKLSARYPEGTFNSYYSENRKEGDSVIEFDDMELMQLKFCMDQTKNQMSMGGEIRRHASIVEKVEAEMNRRREENSTYTREKILRDLEAQIKQLEGEI